MIIYDLCCDKQHRFEGWFKDANEMQQQIEKGILTCPVCESIHISKLPTASKLGNKHKAVTATNKQEKQSLTEYKQAQQALSQIHDYLDKNFIDVGNKFADEAMKIHKGEQQERNIRGVASREQVSELHASGIATLPIPPKPLDKQKLN